MAIKIEYLWQDRKRHLGLPISFTKYSLSEDRLFVTEGFLNIRDDEVLLYRVRDIDTHRSLWQRLFGVGAFAGLSVQEQSILILHFVLDLPDQEIGRLVGMSRSAVQRRRAKSLTELRIKLAALMPKGG